jgi:hypothetical protein
VAQLAAMLEGLSQAVSQLSQHPGLEAIAHCCCPYLFFSQSECLTSGRSKSRDAVVSTMWWTGSPTPPHTHTYTVHARLTRNPVPLSFYGFSPYLPHLSVSAAQSAMNGVMDLLKVAGAPAHPHAADTQALLNTQQMSRLPGHLHIRDSCSERTAVTQGGQDNSLASLQQFLSRDSVTLCERCRTRCAWEAL